MGDKDDPRFAWIILALIGSFIFDNDEILPTLKFKSFRDLVRTYESKIIKKTNILHKPQLELKIWKMFQYCKIDKLITIESVTPKGLKIKRNNIGGGKFYTGKTSLNIIGDLWETNLDECKTIFNIHFKKESIFVDIFKTMLWDETSMYSYLLPLVIQ